MYVFCFVCVCVLSVSSINPGPLHKKQASVPYKFVMFWASVVEARFITSNRTAPP